MLLNFEVENFRCLVEPASLSLTARTLKTNRPQAGRTWIDDTERVAAIYGPNAAGKTTVLEAIRAVATALRNPGSGAIYQPFEGGPEEGAETRYAVEFVSDDVRYAYEVRARPWGIAYESLSAYPKGTRRVVFVRTQSDREAEMGFEKGGSLTGPTAEVRRITKRTMLFLATAHRYGHKSLAPIAKSLLEGVGIDHISFRDRQSEEVLRRVVMEMIASPDGQVDLMRALAQSADLGIDRIEIRSEEVPGEVYERIVRTIAALNDGEDVDEEEIPRLRDVLVFAHKSSSGEEFELPVRRQSSGTITWLTTAWHALDALRQGSVLLVDELDASLHPDLARYLVTMFLTPHMNPKGAQLVFSSHDVSLLSNAPSRLLQPANVWFVEKGEDGKSELYSLADFSTRSGNNSERRYLAGAFGAIPAIDDALLIQFLASEPAMSGHGA